MSEGNRSRQWQIGKVEKVIDSKIQNLEADRKEIRSKADSVENDYAKKRKYVSSVLLFIVPLILTLFSISSIADGQSDFLIYPLDSLRPYLLPALFVVIGGGLIIFLLFDRKKNKVHTLIQSLDDAYLSSIRKLDYFKQYYNTETYYLDFNEDRMNTLFNYAGFASMAVRVDIIKPLENMLNSQYFEKIRSDLLLHYYNTNKTMKFGVRTYEDNKLSWDGNRRDWKNLRQVFSDFFRYNGYRLVITGRITRISTSEEPKSDSGEAERKGAPF